MTIQNRVNFVIFAVLIYVCYVMSDTSFYILNICLLKNVKHICCYTGPTGLTDGATHSMLSLSPFRWLCSGAVIQTDNYKQYVNNL